MNYHQIHLEVVHMQRKIEKVIYMASIWKKNNKVITYYRRTRYSPFRTNQNVANRELK